MARSAGCRDLCRPEVNGSSPLRGSPGRKKRRGAGCPQSARPWGCKAKPCWVSAPRSGQPRPHWSWGSALGTVGPLGTRTSLGPEPILSLGHACSELCPASAGAAGSHAAHWGCTGVSALLLPACGFVLCHQLRAVHLLQSGQGKKRMRLFLRERLHRQPGTVRCGAGKWLKRHVWHHKRALSGCG